MPCGNCGHPLLFAAISTMSTGMANEAAEAKDARARRLAEALRENLRRRKEQSRRRAEEGRHPASSSVETDIPPRNADTNTGNGRT
jgi:hypothetical protein